MASSLLSEIGESIPQSVAESFKIGFLGLFGVFNAYSIYNSLKQTPALDEGIEMTLNMKLWIFGNAAFFSLTVESFILSSISVAVLIIMAVLIFLDFIKDNKLEVAAEKNNQASQDPRAKKTIKHE